LEKTMSELQLTREQDEFRAALGRFRAETQLSQASAARLMDVNPGSMAKWYKADPQSGKVRLPQSYVQDAIWLKIQRLNAANSDGGLYTQLRGLKPSERVNLLQSALDSGHYS
jgi:hypothetical protein